MAISEARKQANKKWNDANMKERYDRIQLVVPKGKKEMIQVHAQKNGESVNAMINRLIDAELNNTAADTTDSPQPDSSAADQGSAPQPGTF